MSKLPVKRATGDVQVSAQERDLPKQAAFHACRFDSAGSTRNQVDSLLFVTLPLPVTLALTLGLPR